MTISAKIVADSIHATNGKRITTFELEYPRFVHAEFMTHRLFSRNAASSRAIPVKRAIELVKENTARPMHWGKNQPGMSAKEECNELVQAFSHPHGEGTLDKIAAWDYARDRAIDIASAFDKAGYHKQIVNRLLEPFTHIKVVLTTTELDNWFWLRNHPDAQPEINELARVMLIEVEKSMPVELSSGDWHLPYFKDGYFKADWIALYPLHTGESYTLEDAIAVSSSCCAQVSYRRLDDSLEKARDIYKRLVETRPVHASPFEHQAKAMLDDLPDEQYDPFNPFKWEDGVTHIKRDATLWSGNFCGWVQNRQLIDGNTCWNYIKN